MDAEQDQRRWRLSGLVAKFGEDNDMVARVIEEKTHEKVSERTIQAWLIAPTRKSSRNCPEWAVKALEDYVADPANRQELEQCAARRESTVTAVKRPLDWSNEVRRNKSVEFATSASEYESKRSREWQDAGGLHLGKMISELERRLDAEVTSHLDTLAAVHEAFRCSSSFEVFKSTFHEHERANNLTRYFVRDARRAIDSGSAEFSSPDGLAAASSS